uniref:Coiled-coil domain-containing protein n=1 Tax=Panagrellus redivivus TaxID=6233 RepID=A0A7E4W2J4_PANRE
MSDREERITDSIAFLEFIRDNHARNLNAAHQINKQLENAVKDGKLVKKISFDMEPKDDMGRKLDPNVFRVDITSAVSSGETSCTTILHDCGTGSTTVTPPDAETTVKSPDEKAVPYDARLDYYNCQIELIKSMRKKE